MTNLLNCLSIILVIISLVPLIRNDYWIFRIFEYPRLQKLTLNAILIAVIVLFYFPKELKDQLIFGVLALNLLYLIYQVFPFTAFAPKQIIKSRHLSGSDNITILIANVFQDNRRSKDYLELINECNPDVILLVETNNWWQQEMDAIGSDYPHQLKVPLENTYGMLFYSRLQLNNGEVKYLVEDDIPSIEVDVRLKSGKEVKLFCLHPQPPVPQENPRSTERDKEILLVAAKAKTSRLPVIVMGDLNDVAWSYTTQLFGKISGLLDPRRGRGFFNSFNAKHPFLRFPLDHLFCSRDFSLTSIRRMNSCGSDHFPMCINLQHDAKAKSQNEKPVADAADKEMAEEKINAVTA
ncbi:MAG: endonuclease/exonuclease/phosphatase family protein [Chitinophagaceae bacterium]|nr:endonuclease/exonuclease/phosphatase family protein [Chitinophagaceae bacterium]